MPRGVFERTPEYRAKQSRAQAGNHRALGYRHTPEERAAISAASDAQWADPAYRARQKVARRRETSGYEAAHDRIRRDLGRVREFACITCDKPAAQWALNHDRAANRTHIQLEGKYAGLPFSLEPADYDPRCVRCHKRYDLDRKKG